MKTANFIKQIDPALHKEYLMERLKESDGRKIKARVQKSKKKKPKKAPTRTLFDGMMDGVKDLPKDHRAVKLLRERMIPRERWDDLYYLDDIRKVNQLKDKYKDRFKKKEGRLVIPYRARDGHVVCIACRSFEPDAKLRYINIPIDEDYPQVYGYDRVDLNKKVYVVEGAFDSMFLPNGIAVSGSNLKMVERILSKNQCTLIYDCEPRNRQLVKQIEEAIEKKYSVALLPDIGYKDINEMVKGGVNPTKIVTMIEENTVQGLRAKLEFSRWKRVA